MSFTCTVQMTGLVREDNPSGKHRSNGKAILAEMAKERISRSETLDRSRTYLNTYDQQNKSGFSEWDDMFNRAENYSQPVKSKSKDGTEITRYRKLQNNAVLGVSIIINPPYYECKDWDNSTYQKFYNDTQDVLEQLNPDIFRKSNQIFGVEHYDEGYDKTDRHKHIVYDAISRDGKYCGSQLDAKFLSDFNKVYPEKMRAKGWDMTDLETTDWQKYKTDEEYRAKKKAKRRRQGRSVNQHIQDRIVKNLQTSKDVLQQAKTVQSNVKQLQAEEKQLQAEISRLQDEYNNISLSIKKQRRAAAKQLQNDLELYKEEQIEEINQMLQDYQSDEESRIKWQVQSKAKAEAEQIISTAKRQAEQERQQIITDTERMKQDIERMKQETERFNQKAKWRESKLKEIQEYVCSLPDVREEVENMYNRRDPNDYGYNRTTDLRQQPPRRGGKPSGKRRRVDQSQSSQQTTNNRGGYQEPEIYNFIPGFLSGTHNNDDDYEF